MRIIVSLLFMQSLKLFLREQSLHGDFILFTVRILAGIDDLSYSQRIFLCMKMGVLIISTALSLYQPRTIATSGLI